MPPEPTIAEERIARLMAHWHGQKPLYRDPKSGTLMTVANMRGTKTGWAHEVDTYVERHWREYVDAARAVLEARS